jgi:diguanylate cyclase (GGDEF)-like protein
MPDSTPAARAGAASPRPDLWTCVRCSLAALLVALLLSAAPLSATESAHFRHYTARDGLPQAQVLAMHQDRSGLLWMGTYGGLGSFDGLNFTGFSTADGLAANTVQAISSEADGTIWAGLTRGVCALRPYHVRFECPQIDGIGAANVNALLVTASGLWIGSNDGLFLLSTDTVGAQRVERIGPELNVSALALAGSERLWVGTHQGLLQIGRDGVIETVELPAEQSDVRALLVDGPRLWIGTSAGLLLRQDGRVGSAPELPIELSDLAVIGLALGPDDELWGATRLGVLRQHHGRFALLDQSAGVANENIHAVLRDREGTLWIAGDGGLNSYLPGALIGYMERDGLLQNFVRTIAEDSQQRLWLGTRQGVQVVRLGEDGRLQPQFTITRADGLVDDRIFSIAIVSDDEVLLATGHGIARWRNGDGVVRLYTEDDGLPGNAPRALRAMADGRVWIGSHGGTAWIYDERIEMASDAELAQARVFRIVEDAQGLLWYGSLQHGVLSLDRQGRVQRWHGGNGVSDEVIWDVAADLEDGVWVGSNGDGLFHLRADGSIRRYTTRDGLVDNFVWQLLVDDEGHVWAYTNRGLSRFDGQDFRTYSEDDGLLHPEGSATAALQAADGTRWFGSAEGLMRYVGGEERVVSAPPVRFSRALAGGEAMLPGTALESGARSLEFHFAAPLFHRNSDLRYRYRLRGADSQWVELPRYRPITYANLGAGSYTFEVQARMAGEPWPERSAEFAFAIQPRPWETGGFWVLMVAAAVLAGWLLVRLRLRQVELRRRQLEQLVRERTEALEHANRSLEEATFTDPLTQLRNRRYFTSQVGIDVAQVRRAYAGRSVYPNRDLIFVMIDIDHFKRINDQHGHTAGDRVLQQYAELIAAVIRESDYAVRWGGEEFLLVARQTEASQVASLAERIVERVRASCFVIDDAGTELRSTCSVGLSHFPFVDGAVGLLGPEHIVEICDAAVYMAKDQGRDGWVAIRGVEGQPIGDPAEFVRQLKADPQALAAQGRIAIASSRQQARPQHALAPR